MPDTPPDVDLPRFVRSIGVTGLTAVDERPEGSPSFGVLSPFAGVLETRVAKDRSRGAFPQLAYLTLAPLVTQQFTTTSERRERVDRTSGDEETPTGSDERPDEPRVREVLRETAREQPTDTPGTSNRDGGDASSDKVGPGVEPDTSELTTLERTVRDIRGEPSGTASGRSSLTTPVGDDPVDTPGVAGTDRTVVRRSDPVDRSVLDGADAGEDSPLPFEERPGSDSRSGFGTTDRPGGSTPAMTVLDESGGGPDGTRSAAGDRSTAIDDFGREAGNASLGRTGPDLTVRRSVRSGRTSGTAAQEDSGEGDSSTSRSDRGTRILPARADSSETRTVFAEDGSVNDRVLDRLHRELMRKRDTERRREGR